MQKSLTIRLSKLYRDAIERMIEGGVYSSRSEIVRESLRMLFEKYAEKYGKKIWDPSEGVVPS